MTIVYGRFHFGTGYPTPLPPGWTLREAADEWAIGIAPSGQEYYLARDAAYPKRIATKPGGVLRPGEAYVDLKNGIVRFQNAEVSRPASTDFATKQPSPSGRLA